MLSAETWYEIVFPPLVTLAVFAVAAVLLWLARGKLAQLVRDLGIRNVSAFGIDLQFAEQQTRVAYEHRKGLEPPSHEELVDVRDAARFLAPLAAQSRILWVDDNPGWNLVERSLLLAWEVDVEAVRSTDEALTELKDRDQSFDLVVSDWTRDSDSDPAGLNLLHHLRNLRLEREPRVLFYHGIVGPDELAKRRRLASEAGAVGATGSPGELLRWILIELARVAIDRPRPEQRARRKWRAAAAEESTGVPPVV